MSKHTLGRIRYDFEQGYCGELIASDGNCVATFTDEPTPEDADRLVACWNAFEGLDTESVKSMVNLAGFFLGHCKVRAQRDELLLLLEELVDMEGPQPGNSAWGDKVRSALLRAREQS